MILETFIKLMPAILIFALCIFMIFMCIDAKKDLNELRKKNENLKRKQSLVDILNEIPPDTFDNIEKAIKAKAKKNRNDLSN